MLKRIKNLLLIMCLTCIHMANAQTSWTGITSTNWKTASNWTNGVPSGAVDAIIGDANFTGPFQPQTSGNVSCNNLTVGNGSISSALNVASNLKVSGSILIGPNGSITSSTNNTITMKGNWTNNGTYTASNNQARIILAGSGNQVFTGSTVFRRLSVNTGAVLVLGSNITVNSTFTVSGTVNPGDLYTINGSGSMSVNASAILYVYKSTFAGNYAQSGSITLNRTSTVNYASASVTQTVSSALTYGTLRISGGSLKVLSANLPGLNAGIAGSGKLYVEAGTFDLKTFTANRASSGGGSFIIAAGAKLMIGGSNGFPANYQTHSLANTSTVEYYGNAQTILATGYGNLTLKSSSGTVVKTMPSSAMVVSGNFEMSTGAGAGVTATAAQNIQFNGNVNIGASCTFNGASYTHTFKSNFTNNGTFNGGTSLLYFSGILSNLSGSGANNFYNTVFATYGISIEGSTALNISGDLSTSTPGTCTHKSGGLITLSGTAKTFTGSGFVLNDLLISGSISSTANYTINGNFTNNGSFTSSGGTATFKGLSKTIGGSALPVFNSLVVEGSISCNTGMYINANLSVSSSGSLTASAGTVTFDGNSTLNGNVALFNVGIAAGKNLVLGSSSVLGIGGLLTVTGTMDVTAFVPNTVSFNSNAAQNVSGTVFHNLELAGSGTKTCISNLTVNNDFVIQSGVSCNAATYTIDLYRNWTNNGTFNASGSEVRLLGSAAALMSGATAFNTLTIQKTGMYVKINLNADMAAADLEHNSGRVYTNSSSITVTNSRTGNGIILGYINHNHAFADGVSYAFEGPDNLITLSNPAGVNSVSVYVKSGEIPDFDPALECVNREYEISVNSGTFSSATLRYHYEDNELNAFSEPFLSIYSHNAGTVWDSLGFDSRDTALNFIQIGGISDLNKRFSASGIRNIVRWNGSVSTDWNDSLNWTTISGANMNNRVPTYTDAAQIGYGSHVYEPIITDSNLLSVLRFGSSQGSELTIDGGTLHTLGSIKGVWSANREHKITVNSGTLTAGTDLRLGDDDSSRNLHLEIGNGTVAVLSTLVQSGASSVEFTGYGDLKLYGQYQHSSGSFTAGDGVVVYTGGEIQEIAKVDYNNLNIAKSTASATFNNPINIGGSLSVSDGSEVFIYDTLNIGGDFVIGSSTLVESEDNTILIGGDWVLNGTFIANSGVIAFNGTDDQNISGGTFNDLSMIKTGGTLMLNDNIAINGNLILEDGVFDIGEYTANRSFSGGQMTLSSNAEIRAGGAANFPGGFQTYTLDEASVVSYNGNIEQQVSNLDYGHLYFENGGTTGKLLTGNITVKGNLQISSGASFRPELYSVILYGHFNNSGTFYPGESTITMKGNTKQINGSTDFYNLSIVEGNITVNAGSIHIQGDLYVESSGTLGFGTNSVTLDGNLTNKGSLSSNGVATFSGNRIQTISLINAISSTSNGVVNFNGTYSPYIYSTSSPSFATVNINNTGGISTSVPWTVYVAMNISSGAVFNGGALTHTFYGNFNNSGTVNSEGLLRFLPGAPFSSSATVKLDGTAFNSTGEIELGGTAPITLSYNNPVLTVVTVSNTDAGGLTLTGNWTITEELEVRSGAELKAGNGLSHLISGSLNNAGTITGQTSLFSFNGQPSEISGSGDFNFHHLTLASGSDLVMNTDIGVSGNLTVNGNLVQEEHSIVFNGSTNSIISGTASPLSISNMEQNKTAGTTSLNTPLTISGYLDLISGKIISTAVNYLNIADNASSSEGSALSFVSGPVRKTGDDAYVFPLGKGNRWARLAISAPSSTGDAFTAQYFDTHFSDTSTMAAGAGMLSDVSKVEYWTCDRTAGSSAVTVKLYWEDAMSGVTNYSTDLVVARWNGSAWENKGQSAITASVPGNVTSNSISAFSPFTFGSLSPNLNPLPVKLLSFTASMNNNNQVDLLWKTISEEDNESFTIEKSSDGRQFTAFQTVQASGNSVTVQSYTGLDENPYSGISYYRLRQNDFNGSFTYSGIVSVLNGRSTAEKATVYPNPAQHFLTVNTANMPQGSISIRNAIGLLIAVFDYNTTEFNVDLSAYSPGVYFLTLASEGKSEQIRFVRK